MNPKTAGSMVTRFALATVLMTVIPIRDAGAVEFPASRIRSEGREARERHSTTADQIVRNLGLGRLQARNLLPLVEEALVLQAAAEQRQAERLPEMKEAFAQYARQARENQEFGNRVEKQAARVSQASRHDRDQTAEALLGLEEQAARILTATQCNYLENGPSGRRAHRRDRDGGNKKLAAAQWELEKASRAVHPRLGRLGMSLFQPAAASALCDIASVRPPERLRRAAYELECGSGNVPAAERDELSSDERQLRGEIVNWHLINGLHLSAEQIGAIVGLYERSPLAVQAAGLRGNRASRQARSSLARLEREVERVLNPGQREVLTDFKPCLVPSGDLKDPVRVGQANDNSASERWLTRARKMPECRVREMVAQTLAREAKRFGSLNPAEHRERESLLLAKARAVAAMSDVDFELSKQDLAEEIAPRDRIQEIRGTIDTLSRRQGIPGTVAGFMLNPQFMNQLRQRERQLDGGVEYTPTDLSQGPQAENCDRGCALRMRGRSQ